MFGILSRKPKSGRSLTEDDAELDSKKHESVPSNMAIQARKNKEAMETSDDFTIALNRLGDDTIRSIDALRTKIGDMRSGAEDMRAEVRRVSRRK